MSNVAKARIAYVGVALENGEMEIRELVPALLAFSDLGAVGKLKVNNTSSE